MHAVMKPNNDAAESHTSPSPMKKVLEIPKSGQNGFRNRQNGNQPSTGTVTVSAGGKEVPPNSNNINNNYQNSRRGGYRHTFPSACSAPASSNSNLTMPIAMTPQQVWEQKRKLFVGGIATHTTEAGLMEHFSAFGQVVDAVVMKDRYSGRSRGFGFVTFSEPHMIDAAQKARPHEIEGRQVETKRAMPREDSIFPDCHFSVTRLHVGSVPTGVSEEELRQYFSQYGTIKQCDLTHNNTVPSNGDNNSTTDATTHNNSTTTTSSPEAQGFAYLTFEDYDPVDHILLTRPHSLNGHVVEVRKALSQEQQSEFQVRQRQQSARFYHSHPRTSSNHGGRNGTMNGTADSLQAMRVHSTLVQALQAAALIHQVSTNNANTTSSTTSGATKCGSNTAIPFITSESSSAGNATAAGGSNSSYVSKLCSSAEQLEQQAAAVGASPQDVVAVAMLAYSLLQQSGLASPPPAYQAAPMYPTYGNPLWTPPNTTTSGSNSVPSTPTWSSAAYPWMDWNEGMYATPYYSPMMYPSPYYASAMPFIAPVQSSTASVTATAPISSGDPTSATGNAPEMNDCNETTATAGSHEVNGGDSESGCHVDNTTPTSSSSPASSQRQSLNGSSLKELSNGGDSASLSPCMTDLEDKLHVLSTNDPTPAESVAVVE